MFLSYVFGDGLGFIFDYTIGFVLKLLMRLINFTLPSDYTLMFRGYFNQFYEGIKVTLFISLVGTIVGFLIALLLGYVRTIKVKKKDPLITKILKNMLQVIVKTYVTVFRGTPMMVQAMIIYYGMISVFGNKTTIAGLVIVTINTGAYLTEVIRGGIESVDNGQTEAARSLGFGSFKTMLIFIYPQAIKNSMAAIGNEFVINIKDTSVLNVIGCVEMYYVVKTSASQDYNIMQQMIVLAFVYLVLTYSVTKILNYIENKLNVPTSDLVSTNTLKTVKS